MREIEKVEVTMIVRTCIDEVYMNIGVTSGLRQTKLGHQVERKGCGVAIITAIAHIDGSTSSM